MKRKEDSEVENINPPLSAKSTGRRHARPIIFMQLLDQRIVLRFEALQLQPLGCIASETSDRRHASLYITPKSPSLPHLRSLPTPSLQGRASDCLSLPRTSLPNLQQKYSSADDFNQTSSMLGISKPQRHPTNLSLRSYKIESRPSNVLRILPQNTFLGPSTSRPLPH